MAVECDVRVHHRTRGWVDRLWAAIIPDVKGRTHPVSPVLQMAPPASEPGVEHSNGREEEEDTWHEVDAGNKAIRYVPALNDVFMWAESSPTREGQS